MNQSKIHRLIFLTYILQFFDCIPLEKYIERLLRGVPHTFKTGLRKIVKIDEKIKPTKAKTMTIVYLLHLHNIRKGFVDQAIRDLIEETEIDFDEENITSIHHRLGEILNELELPKLEINKNLVENISTYSESFRKKYKNLLK